MAHIDYNNPLLNTNHTLNMELNLKFTASLRSNNLGMLILGSNYEPLSIQIPPKSSDFTFTSICHQDCTEVISFKEFEFIILKYFFNMQIEIFTSFWNKGFCSTALSKFCWSFSCNNIK